MIPDKFMKLAALGALGVAPGVAAVYVALLVAFHPTLSGGAPSSGGGIDWTGWLILVPAMLVPLGLLAAWHVDFGKQLKAGKNTCPGV